MPIISKLTIIELSDLKRHEGVISKGLTSFVSVGNALIAINDKKLYRQGFKTFEDYCEKRWGFSRIRGWQLMNAAEAVKPLPPKMLTMVNNERAARELSKVPAGNRKQVVAAAAKEGEVNAKSIQKAARSQEELRDEAAGYPVPDAIRYLWECDETKEMISALSRISVGLQAAQGSSDKRYSEVNFPDAVACLKTLRANLQRVIPYAVCPACQGKLLNACQLCKGRGAISRFLWESPAVAARIKELRKKLAPKK